MTKYWKIGIITGLIVLLVYFNWSVFQKEQVLKNGTFVLMKLAPVDPRSLIQGDYMDLRYENANFGEDEEIQSEGLMVLQLDSNHIGTRLIRQENFSSYLPETISIKYKKAKYGPVHIGAESYFFEEGQADLFSKARYGGLMVDQSGNAILIGLYNENFEEIKK